MTITDMIRGTYQVPPHIELQNPPLPQKYIDFKEEHEALNLKQAARRKKSKPNLQCYSNTYYSYLNGSLPRTWPSA
jgi:hypothetical protein